MPLHPLDHDMLGRALALAQQAIGLSEPNPRVGCVLHDAQGQPAGEGFTQRAGDAHAEVMALRDAAGRDLRGGTAWVSLEPCAHHGRTPPCCDALIGAGLARVVVAVADPFAQVDGRGIARLRAAGVTVDVAEPGELRRAAQALNIGFFSRVLRQRPWVRMKVAASLDGCTALPNGASQWITGGAARADGHRWRKRAGAVLTGIGTVLADDPRLDVREVDTVVQPMRVVVDSKLLTPLSSRLLAPPGRVLLATSDAPPAQMAGLRQAGAEVLSFRGARGRVDLAALLHHLAAEGVNELHVEAGATLNAALLQEGLVDELLVYLAPSLLGPGRPMASLPPLAQLIDGTALQFFDCRPVGVDLCVQARIKGHDSFLD